MLERYIRLADISIVQASKKFLFRRLVNTKNGQTLFVVNCLWQPLSCDRKAEYPEIEYLHKCLGCS